MSDALVNFLNRCDPDGMLAILLIFGGGIAIVVTGIITHHIRESRRRELDASLKQEMLARGMSAEEIERVVTASASVGKKECRAG